MTNALDLGMKAEPGWFMTHVMSARTNLCHGGGSAS